MIDMLLDEIRESLIELLFASIIASYLIDLKRTAGTGIGCMSVLETFFLLQLFVVKCRGYFIGLMPLTSLTLSLRSFSTF